MKKSYKSQILILEALIRGDKDITALNGMKFLTTRITNHIGELRKAGLEIETKNVKTESSHYGEYSLKEGETNMLKAHKILRSYLGGSVA